MPTFFSFPVELWMVCLIIVVTFVAAFISGRGIGYHACDQEWMKDMGGD